MSQPVEEPKSRSRYRAPDLTRGRRDRERLVAVLAGGCGLAGVLLAAASLAGVLPSALDGSPVLEASLAVVGASLLLHAVRGPSRQRRLSAQLADERVLSAAYANRVRDLTALVSTMRTISGVLELDEVLALLLDETLSVFRSSEGSLMLLDDSGFLETSAARGNAKAAIARLKIGDSVAGHVALTREPLLLVGAASPAKFHRLVERDRPLESAMSVPLIHRGELLGVLNVNGPPGRTYADHDLQLLIVFAGHAAIAIANARTVARDRRTIDELSEANRRTTELIATMRHDLRDPLRALRTDVTAVGRSDDQDEVRTSMRRNLRRLALSVDRLLEEAGAGGESLLETTGVTDIAAVAREVTAAFREDGRHADVAAPDTCTVEGDPSLLEQVLWNLLDNAFTHGAPPVRIEVRAEDGEGLVAVSDHGRGIAPIDRERMFEELSGGRSRGSVMGLGLSMVHGIVSSCGGRVWAEDAPEGGARFCVALPLTTRAATEEVPA